MKLIFQNLWIDNPLICEYYPLHQTTSTTMDSPWISLTYCNRANHTVLLLVLHAKQQFSRYCAAQSCSLVACSLYYSPGKPFIKHTTNSYLKLTIEETQNQAHPYQKKANTRCWWVAPHTVQYELSVRSRWFGNIYHEKLFCLYAM